MRGTEGTQRRILASALLAACTFLQAGGTILVVESYHADFPWDASYCRSFQEALGAAYRFEHVRMDTKRLPESRHPAMAEAAWKRYEALKPDLVLLGDDAALKYLAPRLAGTRTPVVYLGINESPRAYYDTGQVRNMTGVLERPNVKRNIIIAGRLVPHARRARNRAPARTRVSIVPDRRSAARCKLSLPAQRSRRPVFPPWPETRTVDSATGTPA